MVHRLFEARISLLQHLSVDIDDVHPRLAVAVGFARVVEDAQSDVPSPARDVDAAHGSTHARTQKRDERVFPEAVYAERHGIIHEVIA